jgi:ABC-type phosphate transport system auxiliary subunit
MYTPPHPQAIETKVAILEEKLHTTEQLMQRIESAIEKMSEVNANVTKMLAVHEQKIDGNDKVDAILFAKIDQLSSKMDKDHNVVLDKLQGLEKKVWVGIGIFAVVTLIINNSEVLSTILTTTQDNGRIERLR